MDFELIEKLTTEQIEDLFNLHLNSDKISVTCYCGYIRCANGNRGTWCGGIDTRSSSYCQYCSAGYCGTANSLCGYYVAGYECC